MRSRNCCASLTRSYDRHALTGAACLLAGHVYMIVLVFALQTVVFGELVSLFDGTAKPHDYTAPGSDGHQHRPVSASRDRKRAEHDKWSKATSWYCPWCCRRLR